MVATPRRINEVIEAHRALLDAETKRALWTAWHIEALARTKQLPDLAELLEGDDYEVDDETLDAQIMAWVHSHNARINAAKLMGITEE